MRYYYRIYGLTIRSEMKFSEAEELEEQPYEVDVSYGTIPANISEINRDQEVKGLLSADYKWFCYEQVGEFYIEKGNCIIAALRPGTDEMLVRSIILGPCFGSILYQRNIFAIHGSAMVRDDKAILICGGSGAGKSTVSTALRQRGWLLLADDTVAVTGENGSLYADPAYPQQKLCLDTALEFGLQPEQLILINEERQKYAIRLKESFCSSKKKIHAMVCLEVSDGEQPVIDEVTGNAKLEYILKNLYSLYDYTSMGMNPADFRRCIDLAGKLPICRVKRPPHLKALNQIVEGIMKWLGDIGDQEKEAVHSH